MTGEPATSAAAGAAGWKLIGGAAGVFGIGASIAMIVVMLMKRPRTAREWAVGLISTIMGSFGGGAYVIWTYRLQSMMDSPIGVMSVIGIVFACGLPAWTLVRIVFTTMEKLEGRDFSQLIMAVFKKHTGAG